MNASKTSSEISDCGNSFPLSKLNDLNLCLEELKRHGEKNKIDELVLTRTQAAFILDDSESKLFSGGTGSGKTSGMAVDVDLQVMDEHPLQRRGKMIRPPINVRAMAPSLTDNVDKDLRPEMIKWLRQDYIDDYDIKHRVLKLKENCPANGSTIEFMSYDQEPDVYAGGTRHVLLLNEPPPELVYTECRARLRARGARTLFGLTPEKNNPHLRWLFLKLVEPGQVKVHYADSYELTLLLHGEKEAEKIMRRVFGNMTEEELQYRRYGRFPTLGGLIFPMFKKRGAPSGHLCPGFKLPDDWMTVMSMDYHKRKPCYALWMAISPKDVWFVYREYKSHPDATIRQIADDIARLEMGRAPWVRFIDPSSANESTRMDSRDRTATREFGQFRSGGRPIAFRCADRALQTGLDAVCERLRFDDKGMPGLLFFQDETKETVEELTHYVWDNPVDYRGTKDLKEAPLKKDDHYVDDLRYLCSARLRYRHPALMRAS